jgi:hypothetical protein
MKTAIQNPPKVSSPEWLEACAAQREAVAATLPESYKCRDRILTIAAGERARAVRLRADAARRAA